MNIASKNQGGDAADGIDDDVARALRAFGASGFTYRTFARTARAACMPPAVATASAPRVAAPNAPRPVAAHAVPPRAASSRLATLRARRPAAPAEGAQARPDGPPADEFHIVWGRGTGAHGAAHSQTEPATPPHEAKPAIATSDRDLFRRL